MSMKNEMKSSLEENLPETEDRRTDVYSHMTFRLFPVSHMLRVAVCWIMMYQRTLRNIVGIKRATRLHAIST